VNVAFFIFGQIPVYTFPLIVGVSAAVGLILITWPVAAFPNLAHLRLNIGCAVLTGALIGGRVGYVWVNWPHFQEYWAEIPQVWLGGLSWPGALAGAILALAAITLRQKFTENFPDILLPLFTSIVIGSWLASWLTGQAYGIEVSAWWGTRVPDEWGAVVIRWPTQLAGILAALGLHWGVDQLRVRGWLRIPGLAASLELAGLSLTILVGSPYRADSAPLWRGIRLDTWAALVFLGLSTIIALFCYVRFQYSHSNPQNPHLPNY